MQLDQLGVADTGSSPHARLTGVALNGVRLADGFWSRWRTTNRGRALAYGYRRLVDGGVLDNFAVAAGRAAGAYRNMRFADSDLYKWLEAAAYLLAEREDAAIQRQVAEAIDLIAAAQMADGYLNTFHQLTRPDRRWTNLRHDHELYCAGHLFQAAVAHVRATGQESLLTVARRFADHVVATFGPGQREGVPGHPEIELALVELYRCTGQEAYLTQAKLFIDRRGRGLIGGAPYHQDHVPAREAQEMAGHAVRQLYLLCGMADLYTETGEPALHAALRRLWADMTQRKMAVTGGVGARHEGESFGESFELPNDRCYNETCAQIGSVMWNWRMLLATGECRYADLLEWTLYNGVLPGVSLDGEAYFYVNPLLSRGSVSRREWFDCACCPPNVMRTLASLPGYFATTSARGTAGGAGATGPGGTAGGSDARGVQDVADVQDADGVTGAGGVQDAAGAGGATGAPGVQIHLYDQSEIRASLETGEVALAVETRYPWEGTVTCTVHRCPAQPWSLSLRVPAWAAGARVAINGDAPAAVAAGQYTCHQRAWQPGDRVVLDLDLTPRFVAAHPYVEAARGRVALTRGPLVYCTEQIDQPAGVNLLDCAVDTAQPPRPEWQGDLLGGLTALRLQGAQAPAPAVAGALYRPYATPNGRSERRSPSPSDGQADAPPASRAARPAEGQTNAPSAVAVDGSSEKQADSPPIGAVAGASRGSSTGAHGSGDGAADSTQVQLTAIPYYAWANRAPCPMAVWLPVDDQSSRE